MIETIVEKYVIRGDDPREPHATESNMKLRAVAVAIAPAVAAIALLAVIDAPESLRWIIPLALVFVGTKLVTGPINDRIEELETTENVRESDGGER